MQVPRAPTREVLSLRAYSALTSLNCLRRDGCTLWQSPDVARIAAVVENKVELLEFRIRDTVDILRDVGIKKKVRTSFGVRSTFTYQNIVCYWRIF